MSGTGTACDAANQLIEGVYSIENPEGIVSPDVMSSRVTIESGCAKIP